MQYYHKKKHLDTHHSSHWENISAEIDTVVCESGIERGIVLITSCHTTAGITVNESADPDVEKDFFRKLSCMVPEKESFYRHLEGNSHSHIKTSLTGISETLHVVDGKIQLGRWQAVYFCEFDGPRKGRSYEITVMGI
jgi:secondary thiamine-phosphate synthase enzyme